MGTILPAVPIPNLSITSVSQPEGNSGTHQLRVHGDAVDARPAANPGALQHGRRHRHHREQRLHAQSGTLTFAVGPIASDDHDCGCGRHRSMNPARSFIVNLTPISGPLGTLQSSGHRHDPQ